MTIYLAARYSRREELCGYRSELEAMGHTVNARWLNGKHQISDGGKPIGDNGEALVEDGSDDRAAALRQHFATEDLNDVFDCGLLIAFMEQPRSGHSRGGRHVEFGIALGLLKPIIAVGPRENIFNWLPGIIHCDTWETAKVAVTVEADR